MYLWFISILLDVPNISYTVVPKYPIIPIFLHHTNKKEKKNTVVATKLVKLRQMTNTHWASEVLFGVVVRNGYEGNGQALQYVSNSNWAE